MKSVYRFCSDHPGLCRMILLLGLTAATIHAAISTEVPFLSVYLADLFIWLVVSRFIATAPGKLLQEPLEIMNQQCDPYPFLEEVERQMLHRRTGPQEQLLLIQYAVGLRVTGHNQKAAEILEGINIDRYPGLTPHFKFMYYNNLSDALLALDRTFEGLIWHRKAKQIYNDLPEGKQKQEFSNTMQLSEAEALYYEGDYDKALRKVAWITCKSQKSLLSAALLAAKCHMALEEPDKAKEKLTYVVERGNKLHITEEAKALLDTLN